MKLGVMQGRLSPPLPASAQYFPDSRWRDEFFLAADRSFDSIEWLYDVDSAETNPLLSAEGRSEIREVSQTSGVPVTSICADYFKNRTLIDPDLTRRVSNARRLEAVVAAALELGVKCVLVPLIEESSIRTKEARVAAADGLRGPLTLAEREGIEIAVETDLEAPTLAEWVDAQGNSSLRVYYDVGNAVAEGFDPVSEILLLGERIAGVHIKDRSVGGPNVPLGTGGVDFGACIDALRSVGYDRPLILETVRGDEYLADASRHRDFMLRVLEDQNRGV